jgi:hypothetical protein
MAADGTFCRPWRWICEAGAATKEASSELGVLQWLLAISLPVIRVLGLRSGSHGQDFQATRCDCAEARPKPGLSHVRFRLSAHYPTLRHGLAP